MMFLRRFTPLQKISMIYWGSLDPLAITLALASGPSWRLKALKGKSPNI
ncbi:hypothetical protein PSTT_06826 [Puccinia striiformis]|uniref:Uncharacterized protein n=1 Tax=Puccinia striiformis TaxID=27350 RepID=A0A2S4VIU8_9BASI|nr:hypothetical protein PSTT_06826 [Puccinia striiformis]